MGCQGVSLCLPGRMRLGMRRKLGQCQLAEKSWLLWKSSGLGPWRELEKWEVGSLPHLHQQYSQERPRAASLLQARSSETSTLPFHHLQGIEGR